MLFSLEDSDDGRSKTLLDWPTVSQKFAWNIVLLLGAGFAMAKAAKVSLGPVSFRKALVTKHTRLLSEFDNSRIRDGNFLLIKIDGATGGNSTNKPILFRVDSSASSKLFCYLLTLLILFILESSIISKLFFLEIQ